MRDVAGETLADDLANQIREVGEAGFVQVITRERVHWRIVPDPLWTALDYNEDTGELRLKFKSSEFKTKVQANTTLSDTLHVVMQFRDIGLLLAQNMQGMVQQIEQAGIEYDHEPGADFRRPGEKDE